MRHKIYLFAIGLLCLSLLGCESKGFRAEKEMWRAHKLAQAIYLNPKGTPQFQLEKAQDAYRSIIKKYPDSFFAVQAKFSVGHLYLVKGEFEKAREEYRKLVSDCDKKGNLCAEAHFAIGNSYELEGKWNDALLQYKTIMRFLPFSAKSLDLPLYIIRHYMAVKDDVSARASVDEAVSYYMGLKSKREAGKGGFILESLIARSYIEGAQWQEALDELAKIVRDYPKNNPEEAIWIRALIYGNKLKDKLKAKEELQSIAAQYPQSKLAKPSQALLKKL